jgi:hypothetical protein
MYEQAALRVLFLAISANGAWMHANGPHFELLRNLMRANCPSIEEIVQDDPATDQMYGLCAGRWQMAGAR